MNDEQLRRVYQAAMRRPDRTAADAPDPELIQRVASGDATEEERLFVLDAVMQSESLRREFDTFGALAAGAAGPKRRAWRPRLLAAAAVLAVVGGTLVWRSASGPDEVWRGGSREVRLAAPAAGAVVDRPITLAWHGVPNAHAYDVELLGDDGQLVTSVVTSDTTTTLSNDLALVADLPYSWRVTARLANGTVLRSRMVRFTIHP